jgi:acyl-CoA synthetase (AMP-forming)/AMP-acid ligase II
MQRQDRSGDMGGAGAEASLIARLHAAARQNADKPALCFLDRGETVTEESTYGQLYKAAGIIAGNLAGAGLTGRPVMLAMPQGLDFIRAFLGCLLAGVIAVPSPFPADRRSMTRFTTIFRAARPAAILGRGLANGGSLRCFTEPGAADCLMLDIADLGTGTTFAGEAPNADAIAFLQYTSGSVSNPKGVVITHRNLAGNLAMIRAAFQLDETKRLVSWLPLHHDMGLIGCVLAPLFAGMRVALMPPFAFLQRPMRWLRAMDLFRATVAGAPNFAYDLCARQVTEVEAAKLDLSLWELAFCGSEPIRQGTLRRFAERFATSGFRPGAQLACYGLAEATLLVTATRPGAGAGGLSPAAQAKGRTTISCGTPCPGTHVVLAPMTAQGGADGAGEICISGEHVSKGFWDGEAGVMRADPERELVQGGRRYLRTGDAGVLVDGELHVVGRLSDRIIVNGIKIHAEDIEATVLEFADAGDLSSAAAFDVHAAEREELVVACELKRRVSLADPVTLLGKLSRAVADAHGILPMEIVLLESGGLERTSSGKVRRAATRARYLAGTMAGISWRSPLRRPGVARS